MFARHNTVLFRAFRGPRGESVTGGGLAGRMRTPLEGTSAKESYPIVFNWK